MGNIECVSSNMTEFFFFILSNPCFCFCFCMCVIFPPAQTWLTVSVSRSSIFYFVPTFLSQPRLPPVSTPSPCSAQAASMARRALPWPPSRGPATPPAQPPATRTPTGSCSIVLPSSLRTANPALPSLPKAPWPDPRPSIAFRKIPGGYQPFSLPNHC